MEAMAAHLLAQRAAVSRLRHVPGGTLWILGKPGRTGTIRWRADRDDEAGDARSAFDQLCRHGYRAFLIGPFQPLRSVTRFDAGYTQVILTPGPAAGWDDGDAAAWRASVEEAGSLLRHWFSGLGHKKTAPLQMRPQLRASREALALLLRVLNSRQRQSLRETGSFMLLGGASGLRYRVRTSGQANIEQLDADGAVAYRLCIAPACELAFPGWLAMQALHLQDPETEYPFVAAAQVFPGRG